MNKLLAYAQRQLQLDQLLQDRVVEPRTILIVLLCIFN